MVWVYWIKWHGCGTHRWPVSVFNNVLDLAAISSLVLYKECTGNTTTRRDIILQLALE
ncbi:UNVERIFIED_CONTAM: hypothetical protein FKN15_076468 [Acipenser sinensis]